MDIINTYDVVTYKDGDRDKYTNDIFMYGCTIHYMNGQRHRDPEGDQPAIIYSDGDQEWWVNGKRHRDNDKPAVIYPDGTHVWYINGELHRDNNKPAYISFTGEKAWWVNGKFIRSE